MKSPLRYQATEYDCGPTTMTNAILFLFEREEIPPDLVRHIGQCTLDSFDETGHIGKYGTSGAAIRYFGYWFNELRHAGLLQIRSAFLEKEEVVLGEGSRLTQELQNDAAVVLHVFFHGFGHYLLLTGTKAHQYFAFDPYYQENPILSREIISVKDAPFSHNLIISEQLLNRCTGEDYSLGEINTREALVLRRESADSLYII